MDGDAVGYLAKAVERLETAQSEFDHGRCNSCANRCYYACFSEAIAALVQEGIHPRGRWTHEAVQAQFTGHLINRRKRFGVDLGQALSDNRDLRAQADYRTAHVTETQAARALRKARLFVAAVTQRSDTNR